MCHGLSAVQIVQPSQLRSHAAPMPVVCFLESVAGQFRSGWRGSAWPGNLTLVGLVQRQAKRLPWRRYVGPTSVPEPNANVYIALVNCVQREPYG